MKWKKSISFHTTMKNNDCKRWVKNAISNIQSFLLVVINGFFFFFGGGFGLTPSLFNNGICALQKSFINRLRSMWHWLKSRHPPLSRDDHNSSLLRTYFTCCNCDWDGTLCGVMSSLLDGFVHHRWERRISRLFHCLPGWRSFVWWIHTIKDGRPWKTEGKERQLHQTHILPQQWHSDGSGLKYAALSTGNEPIESINQVWIN